MNETKQVRHTALDARLRGRETELHVFDQNDECSVPNCNVETLHEDIAKLSRLLNDALSDRRDLLAALQGVEDRLAGGSDNDGPFATISGFRPPTHDLTGTHVSTLLEDVRQAIRQARGEAS